MLPSAPQMAVRGKPELNGHSVMILKSKARGSLKMLLILGASVIAGAQTQPTERQSPSSRGSERYWLEVDEFADRAIHFAYAKRFVQLHEGLLTDRQCTQYSRIAADYADQLGAVKQAGMFVPTGFWNDVREYSISMIGAPGVPIPIHRTSNYWVTTGSQAEDRELQRLVSLEIDNASSQLMTGGNSPLALKPDCLPAAHEQAVKAQR